MRHRRFSIKGLMAAVAALGLGFAALIQPNEGWAFALPALHITMLLTAILGALLRRGEKQAFWIGFAVFGWFYGALLLLWKSDDLTLRLYPPFITLVVLPSEISSILRSGNRKKLAELMAAFSRVNVENHFQVLASLQGLLFACIGGAIARRFSRNETSASEQDRGRFR